MTALAHIALYLRMLLNEWKRVLKTKLLSSCACIDHKIQNFKCPFFWGEGAIILK